MTVLILEKGVLSIVESSLEEIVQLLILFPDVDIGPITGVLIDVTTAVLVVIVEVANVVSVILVVAIPGVSILYVATSRVVAEVVKRLIPNSTEVAAEAVSNSLCPSPTLSATTKTVLAYWT